MPTSALASITADIATRGFVMIHGWMGTDGMVVASELTPMSEFTSIRRGGGGRPGAGVKEEVSAGLLVPFQLKCGRLLG